MFRLLIYTTLLLAALAQNPIPRQGNSWFLFIRELLQAHQ